MNLPVVHECDVLTRYNFHFLIAWLVFDVSLCYS